MNVERTSAPAPSAAARALDALARLQGAAAASPAAAARATEPAARTATPPPSGEASAHEAGLRDVLSPEERAFFDQIAALGPLTYGRPRGNTASLAPTGQRLDVRG